MTAAPLDSLQTLFGPPPKRRSTGRRRSRSGTPRQPPKPAVTVSPSDESVDSRDGRPPVVDARYPAPTPPWEYEVDGDTDIMLPDGRIISTADAADAAFVAAAAAASAFVGDAVDAAAAAADAFVDDAASVDTSVCSERQTGGSGGAAWTSPSASTTGLGGRARRAQEAAPRGVRRRRLKTHVLLVLGERRLPLGSSQRLPRRRRRALARRPSLVGPRPSKSGGLVELELLF